MKTNAVSKSISNYGTNSQFESNRDMLFYLRCSIGFYSQFVIIVTTHVRSKVRHWHVFAVVVAIPHVCYFVIEIEQKLEQKKNDEWCK